MRGYISILQAMRGRAQDVLCSPVQTRSDTDLTPPTDHTKTTWDEFFYFLLSFPVLSALIAYSQHRRGEGCMGKVETKECYEIYVTATNATAQWYYKSRHFSFSRKYAATKWKLINILNPNDVWKIIFKIIDILMRIFTSICLSLSRTKSLTSKFHTYSAQVFYNEGGNVKIIKYLSIKYHIYLSKRRCKVIFS
jgi:hypothetical protein